MDLRAWTRLLLLLNIVFWIAWDIWVWRGPGYPGSVTSAIRDAVNAHPLVLMAIWFVLGHLFWP